MSVSDFVRGGLYDIQQPTVVMTHGEPMGMWVPRGQYENFYGSVMNTTSSTPDWNTATIAMASSSPLLRSASTVPDPIRAAVAQLHAYLNTEEEIDGEEEGS